MDATATIYLFIVFFLLAFITDILPFLQSARNISGYSQESLAIIRAEDLDDDKKQSILLKNSLGIFKESFKIIIFTTILIGLLFGLLRAGSLIRPLTYAYLTDFLVSIAGVLISVISFLSYFLARKLYGKLRV